jgi:hypothetical protein
VPSHFLWWPLLSAANLGSLKILLYMCQERLFVVEEQIDKEIISPLSFFILVPVFLQNTMNKAITLGLLTLPILSLGCADFPIPQNVYDTVIIMEVSTK